MVFLCSPSKQLLSSKLIFKTADFMWISINDKSTDYNFYTKRAILGTIYSVVILFWLNDKSNKLDKTYNLLEKLIMNMNFISSLKECLKEKFF
jgi:ubiquinone biosynthesis protein COQ9